MDQPTIQILVSKAEKTYRSGKYAEAASLYEQAAKEYVLAGDSLKVAEMANNRSVALLQAGDAQGAFDAVLGTDLIFNAAGDVQRQAFALGNQAAALEALNRLEDALIRYRQSAELLKAAGDEDNRASVLKSISVLQIRTGHQLEALASMDAALEQKKKLGLQEKFLKKIIQVSMQMIRRGG